MQQYEFETTIEKGIINIPTNILNNLSPQVRVVIHTENNKNITEDITLASEKSLATDWLLLEEDLVWQNL